MPVSIKRYTELKLAVSDYLQSRNWLRLFELCGTSDDETGKTIAVIFTFFDEKSVWKFLSYVRGQDAELRREKRDSVATVCYIIGKMGQSDIQKSLDYLKKFLSDDHALKSQVTQALSNLWVLDPKKTEKIVEKSWISGETDETIQETGVRSCQFLAEKAPAVVAPFLKRVSQLNGKKAASGAARYLIQECILERKRKLAPRINGSRKRERKS